MIYPGLGPSIFVDVSMADQVEHWIHSVLAVLPDSKVVSSIPVHGGVKNSFYSGDGHSLVKGRLTLPWSWLQWLISRSSIISGHFLLHHMID